VLEIHPFNAARVVMGQVGIRMWLPLLRAVVELDGDGILRPFLERQ
jgi:hypothetical protein